MAKVQLRKVKMCGCASHFLGTAGNRPGSVRQWRVSTARGFVTSEPATAQTRSCCARLKCLCNMSVIVKRVAT